MTSEDWEQHRNAKTTIFATKVWLKISVLDSVSVHDYDTDRLLCSKPQKMYPPENKIHWPVKRKKSERPKYQWIALNQETCLFWVESFSLQNTSTQWRTIATSQENTAGHTRCNFQLWLNAKFRNLKAMMGNSLSTTISFISLAFLTFLWFPSKNEFDILGLMAVAI